MADNPGKRKAAETALAKFEANSDRTLVYNKKLQRPVSSPWLQKHTVVDPITHRRTLAPLPSGRSRPNLEIITYNPRDQTLRIGKLEPRNIRIIKVIGGADSEDPSPPMAYDRDSVMDQFLAAYASDCENDDTDRSSDSEDSQDGGAEAAIEAGIAAAVPPMLETSDADCDGDGDSAGDGDGDSASAGDDGGAGDGDDGGAGDGSDHCDIEIHIMAEDLQLHPLCGEELLTVICIDAVAPPHTPTIEEAGVSEVMVPSGSSVSTPDVEKLLMPPRVGCTLRRKANSYQASYPGVIPASHSCSWTPGNAYGATTPEEARGFVLDWCWDHYRTEMGEHAAANARKAQQEKYNAKVSTDVD